MLNNIYEWLEVAGVRYENTPEQKKLGMILVEEEFNELIIASYDENRPEIIDGICDVIWTMVNLALFHNITAEEIEDYLDKVNRSNWSKFCRSEMIAQMTVDAYAKGEHPDKPGEAIESYYDRYDGVWVVKRKSDNKVLKSIYYTPVSNL